VFLNTELFTMAPEVQLLADHWRWDFNTFRPIHKGLPHESNHPLS
jgi:hypothetical protein